MRKDEPIVIKKEIDRCEVTIRFAEAPVDEAMTNIRNILTAAFDERV